MKQFQIDICLLTTSLLDPIGEMSASDLKAIIIDELEAIVGPLPEADESVMVTEVELEEEEMYE